MVCFAHYTRYEHIGGKLVINIVYYVYTISTIGKGKHTLDTLCSLSKKEGYDVNGIYMAHCLWCGNTA